jgi:hypothetical protein
MNESLISRRRVLNGISTVIAGCFPLMNYVVSKEQDKSENKKETSPVTSPEFYFSFTTYIIGNEWFSNKKDKKVNSLDKWDIKKPGSFISFDFSPKELVLANLYQDEKMIAENIKDKNLHDFFIQKTNGKTRFKVDFKSPAGARSYDEEVNLLSNQEIFDIFLSAYDSQESKLPVSFNAIDDYEQGILPRCFNLKVQEKPVGLEYNVYGIESLIDIDSKEMLNFWKYRKHFKNIQDFRKYIKEYDSSELKIHNPEIKIKK